MMKEIASGLYACLLSPFALYHQGCPSISYWLNRLAKQLSNNRRISTSVFKGKTYVNIREYYGTDGDLKPGKKVCLSRLP